MLSQHFKHHPEFAESLTAISYMDFDEVKEWEKLSIPLQTNMKEDNCMKNSSWKKLKK
jgi:hypothetical protein